MERVGEARVSLHLTEVRRGPDALEVRYSLSHEGGPPVWVLDQLFRTNPVGDFHLEPARAYVEVEGTTLVISRALRPVPDDVDVEAPEVPCARELAAGERLSGEVRVPLPLHEDLPYRKTRPLALAPLRSVRLRIGYLVGSSELRFHEAMDDKGRLCRAPGYSVGVRGQRFLEAGPRSLPRERTP